MKKIMRFLVSVIRSLMVFNSFRTPQTRPGWKRRLVAFTGETIVMPEKPIKRKLAR